jgi:Transposase DDE domain
VRKEPKLKVITRQLTQSLTQMLAALPSVCDRGTKCNAQHKVTRRVGTAISCASTRQIVVSVSTLLTSASVHDSQTAMPLALMSQSRVTSCYDLMNATYCSTEIREHSRSLRHIPLIDHNPRGGEKAAFDPAEAWRYKERSQAERINARLKDEFGGRQVWVKGLAKVMSHLMFGLLAATADQLLRLLI